MTIFTGSILLLVISSTAGLSLFALERDLRSPAPCLEAYHATVDWMKMGNSRDDTVQLFTELGFSLNRQQQFKEFICTIPDVSNVRQLARLTPQHNYSKVAEVYAMYSKSDEHAKKLSKRLTLEWRVNTLARELGISVGRDFAEGNRKNFISLFGDRHTMLKFFSTLEKEFGTFFIEDYDDDEPNWFSDVPTVVDILQERTLEGGADDLEGAAFALGISQQQLEHFLFNVIYAIWQDPRQAELGRMYAAYLNKMDAIGFFSLSHVPSSIYHLYHNIKYTTWYTHIES